MRKTFDIFWRAGAPILETKYFQFSENPEIYFILYQDLINFAIPNARFEILRKIRRENSIFFFFGLFDMLITFVFKLLSFLPFLQSAKKNHFCVRQTLLFKVDFRHVLVNVKTKTIVKLSRIWKLNSNTLRQTIVVPLLESYVILRKIIQEIRVKN